MDEEFGICLADAEDTEAANVPVAAGTAAVSVSDAENAKFVLMRLTVPIFWHST